MKLHSHFNLDSLITLLLISRSESLTPWLPKETTIGVACFLFFKRFLCFCVDLSMFAGRVCCLYVCHRRESPSSHLPRSAYLLLQNILSANCCSSNETALILSQNSFKVTSCKLLLIPHKLAVCSYLFALARIPTSSTLLFLRVRFF